MLLILTNMKGHGSDLDKSHFNFSKGEEAKTKKKNKKNNPAWLNMIKFKRVWI